LRQEGNDEALYRNLDRLHPNREGIERELAEREKSLFNLDETLLDLVAIYLSPPDQAIVLCVVTDYPRQEIHVVLASLSTHKPKRDRWQARHLNVHWHYTPTHASWLNQVEVRFSILTRQALRGASFTSPRQVREAIDRFLAAYNAQAAPFEWRKRVVHSVGLKKYYDDLCH
jgi:hypothetical protein